MTQTNLAQSTIALTGVTGFIGAHLVSRLDELKCTTRALVRGGVARAINAPDSTKIVKGSLGDRDSNLELLNDAQICIHAAGATKSIDMSGFHTANVIGTHSVAAYAAACGVQHFIYLSSQAARAPERSNYAASKAISESALGYFGSRMKVTIIRPPAVLGAGDPMLKPMFDLIKNGWLPAPMEPKTEARRFAVISVSDLVDQIVAVAEAHENAPAVVEPCSVASTGWQDVADAAGEVLSRNVRVLRIWPGAMGALGYAADGVSQLIRRPMPISYGKVQEMLAADWSYDRAPQNAMKLREIMKDCLLD